MSEERWFMKEPCKHCPFRRDVTPFLHPERAEEIAYAATNPYSAFHCHKTTEYDEDGDSGDMLVTARSLMCAGFLTLQVEEGGASCPDGFEPSREVYGDSWEMIDAYTEEWKRDRKRSSRRGR